MCFAYELQGNSRELSAICGNSALLLLTVSLTLLLTVFGGMGRTDGRRRARSRWVGSHLAQGD